MSEQLRLALSCAALAISIVGAVVQVRSWRRRDKAERKRDEIIRKAIEVLREDGKK